MEGRETKGAARAGRYVQQPTGYQAFLPAPLPPDPPLRMDDLRNMSRGRGIGFFEAGNFFPDFILWLLDGDRQYVSFIDPKGLRNLEGPEDPKIRFHLTIKDLEGQLGDPAVVLNSFIVSSTRVPEVAWWDDGMTKDEFEARNVLFQREDRATYIEKLLGKVTGGG